MSFPGIRACISLEVMLLIYYDNKLTSSNNIIHQRLGAMSPFYDLKITSHFILFETFHKLCMWEGICVMYVFVCALLGNEPTFFINVRDISPIFIVLIGTAEIQDCCR